MSGLVIRHDKDWIVVATKGQKKLLIEEVLNEKSENILKKIKVGDRFFTPHDIINKSRSFRVRYNSLGIKK